MCDTLGEGVCHTRGGCDTLGEGVGHTRGGGVTH